MKPKENPLPQPTNGQPSNIQHANGLTLQDGASAARTLLELTNGAQGNGNLNSVSITMTPEKWKGMAIVNESQINGLIEVYVQVVYPM